MRYKVLAITEEGNEIQKKFNTREEAEAYAKRCYEHGCWSIRIAEGNY